MMAQEWPGEMSLGTFMQIVRKGWWGWTVEDELTLSV